ncbi:MAG: ferrous iron transport protein A [Planctomycetota bacterium]|nr:MAG: ferrous iron transport protein A [Planctomycetota bacterium]
MLRGAINRNKNEIQSHLDMVSLRDIPPGTCARLLEVGGEADFRRRLMELGFLPGTLVRLVRRVNVGDLVELEVRGCHVSLRRAEAEQLFVERQGA